MCKCKFFLNVKLAKCLWTFNRELFFLECALEEMVRRSFELSFDWKVGKSDKNASKVDQNVGEVDTKYEANAFNNFFKR